LYLEFFLMRTHLTVNCCHAKAFETVKHWSHYSTRLNLLTGKGNSETCDWRKSRQGNRSKAWDLHDIASVSSRLRRSKIWRDGTGYA
jgi:hypothetical protein